MGPVWIAREGEAARERTTRMIRRKYGFEYRIVMGVERLARSKPSDRAILRINTD